MKQIPSLLIGAFLAANLASLGGGQRPQRTQGPVPAAVKPSVVHFEDIARQVGITAQNFYGSDTHKEFIIETTGNGSIIFDYDNDGWPDIFLPNGSTVEGFPNLELKVTLGFSKEFKRNGAITAVELTAAKK